MDARAFCMLSTDAVAMVTVCRGGCSADITDVLQYFGDAVFDLVSYYYYYYLLIMPKQLTCRHKNDKSSEH